MSKGGTRFRRLQERLSDPLVTALTIMLAILLFVVGPLQGAGIVAAHQFGIAFGVVLVVAVFIVSDSWIAVAAIVIAVVLIVLATVMRLRQPSAADIYLDATAWMITGMTLSIVGYGDIVPLHPFARGLANVEAIIGQLYPATLLARLVTLEIEGRRGR